MIDGAIIECYSKEKIIAKVAGFMKEAKKICFLGKGGVGKSIIASNLSEALVRAGYHVLQIGNDSSLSSTILLRGFTDAVPALEEYRKNYVIQLADYIIKTASGAYCLELGSLEPGVGCMARGIQIIDEMMEMQGITDALDLDYIIYDIAGDIPCTGYILPMRDGIMDTCIVVTDGSVTSFVTANSIIAGIVKARRNASISIQMLVNYADRYPTRSQLDAYAVTTQLTILDYLDYYQRLEHSELAGETIFVSQPDSKAALFFTDLVEKITVTKQIIMPQPLGRNELFRWLRLWKQQSLDQKSGVIGGDYSGNI